MSKDLDSKQIAKKKLSRKTIDIESEFIGAIPPHKKKSEKKSDCTAEIKNFLENPITLESIKFILMRVYKFSNDNARNTIKVISVLKTNRMNDKYHHYDFFIYIHAPNQNHHYEFILGHWNFFQFSLFKVDLLDTSILKQQLAHSLRTWFENNLDQTIRVEI